MISPKQKLGQLWLFVTHAVEQVARNQETQVFQH